VTGPEHPARPGVPIVPRGRYRWLVVAGFVLAVVAMVLGIIFAAIPIVLGAVLATSGRQRAGIAIIVTTVLLVAVPRLVFYIVLDGGAYRIPSGAMEPTLKIGDRIATLGDDSPDRGDLFVFHPPAAANHVDAERCGTPRGARQACSAPAGGPGDATFVKRVVALPGDRLTIVGNHVHVYGVGVDEPYVRTEPCTEVCDLPKEITIPPDHYFMLGDNRGESDDSRSWGPVPRDWLVGRASFRYWPLSRFGSL
jgi:signal peptidase I